MDLRSSTFRATHERLRTRFGERADQWWEALPGVLDELHARWDLTPGDPTGQGNTSLVVKCHFQGRAAVLKITVEPELALAEATALHSWRSSGRVPEVWRHDASLGALLLEAISHQRLLADHGVINIGELAHLVSSLHSTGEAIAEHGVVDLSDRIDFMWSHWTQRHGDDATVVNAIPAGSAARGYELAHSLVAATRSSVLLHGDLHAGNVLVGSEGRGLVAIDPRPCVGPGEFDLVDWVFWPEGGPSAWTERAQQLANALEYDGEMIWEWCRAFAAIIAGTTATSGGDADRVQALTAIAP